MTLKNLASSTLITLSEQVSRVGSGQLNCSCKPYGYGGAGVAMNDVERRTSVFSVPTILHGLAKDYDFLQ